MGVHSPQKMPVMAWIFETHFFWWMPNPKKCASYGMESLPPTAWWVSIPTKIGASYGMRSWNSFFGVGAKFNKQNNYGMESLLPIFIWVVLPKQDAISGITGFPFPFGVWILKMPVMAWKSYPYMFGGSPKKNNCHVWHGNHIPIWCFTIKNVTLFICG